MNEISLMTNMDSLNEAVLLTALKKLGSKFLKTTKDKFPLTEAEKELIRDVKNIDIDSSYRVVTYKNIHGENKFNIDLKCMFDHVMSKIYEDSRNMASSFDSAKVIREGISLALKFTTGSTPAKEVGIKNFKYFYQLRVFGAYEKVQVYPKMVLLIMHATKTPALISFLERHLIFNQLQALDERVSKEAHNFANLANKDPKHRRRYRAYVNCMVDTLNTMLSMYKIIRNTLVIMQKEYFNVFREIKHININSNLYLECSDVTNIFIRSLNESIESNASDESDVSSQSVDISMGIEFIRWTNDKKQKFDEVKQCIESGLTKLSMLDTDRKYQGIPNIVSHMPDYANAIRVYINSLDELLKMDHDSLIQDTRVRLNIVEPCSDLNSLCSAIHSMYTKLSDSSIDTETIVNNVLTGLSLVDELYGFRNKICDSYDQNSIEYEHFKNVYIVICVIVDTIIADLLAPLRSTIDMCK